MPFGRCDLCFFADWTELYRIDDTEELVLACDDCKVYHDLKELE
jgi:hypothetical protein